jgi:hypothetical protein
MLQLHPDGDVPLVSVLFPVYNDARYLQCGLDSILSQTFSNFEVVVVNDGSTDESRDILLRYRYRDPRIRLINNEHNLGLAPSLNRAIEAARGAYLARQDADDIAHPRRFAKQVEFLELHPEIALLGSRAIAIDEEGNERHVMETSCSDSEIKWDLLFFCPFVHSSVMLRRSILDRTGVYTEDPLKFRAFVEDYDLWSRINRVARSANLEEPLQKYRYRRQPTSASARMRTENERQAEEISKQNICWLLGRHHLEEDLWCTLKLFSPVGQRSLNWPVGVQQTRGTLELLTAIEDSFCSKYVPESKRAGHRMWQYSKWVKRAAELAMVPGLRLNNRVGLVTAVLKLAVRAFQHPDSE